MGRDEHRFRWSLFDFSRRAPLAGRFLRGPLSSCAGFRPPEFQRPDSPAKSSWSPEPAAVVSAADTISPDWWSEFRDPYLDALVTKAIAGNFDIKILAARTQVANAQIAEAQAGALPILDLGAGASFEKSTGQKLTKQFNIAAGQLGDRRLGQDREGRTGTTAEVRATEADWRAGYLTLVSGVSTTYFEILQFDEQIERQLQALNRNNRILTIYEAMFANGLAPQSQVLRQKAEVNRLTSDLLELRRSRALSQNALATLIGVPAGELKVAPGRLLGSVQPSRRFPSVCRRSCCSVRPRHCRGGVPGAGSLRPDWTGHARAIAQGRFDRARRVFRLSPSDLLKSFTFGFIRASTSRCWIRASRPV